VSRAKPIGTHVTYTHICAKCPDVRVARVKRRTNLCGKCSRTYAKKTNVDKFYFDYEAFVIKCIPKVRHYKVCTKCEKAREVPKYLAGFGVCAKCSSKVNGAVVKVNYKPKKKKSKLLSESAKVILREEREEFKKKEKAKEKFPQLDEHTSLSMQEEFLRKRR